MSNMSLLILPNGDPVYVAPSKKTFLESSILRKGRIPVIDIILIHYYTSRENTCFHFDYSTTATLEYN